MFSLLNTAYAFDSDLMKYAHLLGKFANHGIDPVVIKDKLRVELTASVNTSHTHSDGTYKTELRYKTLKKQFGDIFCRLAKYDVLPKLDYTHDMRVAIFKSILKLPSQQQESILRSILNHDNSDFGQLFWRASYLPLLYGTKVKLPDYWKNKVDAALANLHIHEEKPALKHA